MQQRAAGSHAPALDGCTTAFHSCRKVLGSTMVTSPCGEEGLWGSQTQSRGEVRWKAGRALEARAAGAEQHIEEAQARALCTRTSHRWALQALFSQQQRAALAQTRKKACCTATRWQPRTSHCCVNVLSQREGTHGGSISCSCRHLRQREGGAWKMRPAPRQNATMQQMQQYQYQCLKTSKQTNMRSPVAELALRHHARHAQAALEVEEGDYVGAGLGHDEVVGAEHLAAEGGGREEIGRRN